MMEDGGGVTDRCDPSLISLMLTFNTVVNLGCPLSFLWFCFLKFKFNLHLKGARWILVRKEGADET